MIPKYKLKNFRILFQNIYSTNYIEQDYIEEDIVSVTYVIGYR